LIITYTVSLILMNLSQFIPSLKDRSFLAHKFVSPAWRGALPVEPADLCMGRMMVHLLSIC